MPEIWMVVVDSGGYEGGSGGCGRGRGGDGRWPYVPNNLNSQYKNPTTKKDKLRCRLLNAYLGKRLLESLALQFLAIEHGN